MKIRKLFLSIISVSLLIHAPAQKKASILNPSLAAKLAALPLHCIQKEFPYKTGIVFSDTTLIQSPKTYHPAFYGCFDWHSSVHGHWMLIKLLKLFPELDQKEAIRQALNLHLTAANMQKELDLFGNKDNKSFERTYGWAWLFQLQNELLLWKEDADAKRWAEAVQPLAKKFAQLTIDYLGRLVYPIRAGEHSNLAFGLRLTYDYARTSGDTALQNAIKKAAFRFYTNDANCPLSWEPSGYDFLSPCLEEAALMSRLLHKTVYEKWLRRFLPDLFRSRFTLEPGKVKDRSDGKLVHLDGLNLSRVWCLQEIGGVLGKDFLKRLSPVVQEHLAAGLQSVARGDYAGDHWLASFAVYALTSGEENTK
jgi:hypothetical protein